MAKATFPFTLTNNIDRYADEKRKEIIRKYDITPTWKQIFDDCGNFCGVTGHTIRMIRSGSSNPSVTLAFLMAKYFNTTVDDLFGVSPEEEGLMEKLDNWKPCGLE
ncbi:hypothetical protein IAQ67_28645 (plasmid) [Paenibacillus peoriae]|uniref:HTH cro/C1-type domain-containing protein n=1 Tax=Paenibacillus peoriae TaxID=59893 RepID=A0A7H0YHC3_9BACL|nr:hypothetical protein [Paenibacillus peoriae]QNR70481.1 hypothetical protein IAQ67_28645 [Paenibacillus peoriae]